MNKLVAACALVCSLATIAAARPSRSSWYTAPPGNVFVASEQRGIFGLVRNRQLGRQVCGGMEPAQVQTTRTAGQTVAAVLTLGLWTPTRLKVTCPSSPARL